MLTLLLGDFQSGKSGILLSRIQEDLENKTPAFLLVPEQETVQAELRFSEALPADAPLLFEVTNFSRLANTVFRKKGGVAGKYATPAVRALCMWKAVNHLSPLMHTPEKPDRNGIAGYLAAVDELRRAAISPSALAEISEQIKDKRLSEKCMDLAGLAAAFSATLGEKYADNGEDADRLAEILENSPLFLQTNVYIDSFTSFTEQEYRIIAALMRQTHVVISLCIPAITEGTVCYAETENTCRRLKELAKEAGVSISLHRASAPPPRPPMLYHAMELLKGTDSSTLPYEGKADESLHLVEAASPFDEADYIAADIAKRVRLGARYRDFAIVAADASVYAELLNAALDKANIPYFNTTRKDPSTYEVVKLIHSAYTILHHGWRGEDTVSYLKCGFSDISLGALDLFELYIETWHLEGTLFTDGRPWRFHPEGPDGKPSPESEAALAILNQTKESFLPPLLQLGKSAVESTTVRNHATALYEFLLAVRAEERLFAKAEEAVAAGNPAEAEEMRLLWEAILDTLDTLVDTIGEETLSGKDFHELFSVVLSQTEIGGIPSSPDEVMIGSADTMRIGAPEVVYLFGLSEGEFPAAVKDDGFFSAAECAVLERLNLPCLRRPEEDAARARFSLLRALLSARKEAVLLYPLADSALHKIRPSGVVELFRRSFGEALPTVRTALLTPEDRIFTPEMAAERLGEIKGTAAGEALSTILGEMPLYEDLPARILRPMDNTTCTVSEKTVSLLYKQALHLSQSSMERFQGCPFSYWCISGLSLKEEKRMEFAQNIIGSYVHLLLEIFFSRLEQDGKNVHTLTEEDVAAYARIASEESACAFFPDKERIPARTVFLLEKLSSLSNLLITETVEEFAQSEFSPIFQELQIGKEGGPDRMIFRLGNGMEVSFSGIIDRVDGMVKNGDLYLRVVDYKTGNKEFSPEDVKKGKNIQVLLYLAALWKSRSPAFRAKLSCTGEIIPAAVEYLVVGGKDPVLEVPMTPEEALAAAKQRLLRVGLAMDDETILRAMDKNLSGRFIPGKNTGTDFSRCKEHLFSLETLGDLLEDVSTIVESIGTEICTGWAFTPTKEERERMDRDPCTFCQARLICRNVSK